MTDGFDRPRVLGEARPWGRFDQYATNQPATVKVITSSPRQRLSLQRHGNRAELRVVLEGPLHVTVGAASWMADAEDLVWIQVGTVHRLANPNDSDARILEVALGWCDEGDIERFGDDYARVSATGQEAHP
jgi:mannose-1-phosphate guanylyltransferase/mannose-6-phosphate isomerase